MKKHRKIFWKFFFKTLNNKKFEKNEKNNKKRKVENKIEKSWACYVSKKGIDEEHVT